MEASCLSLYPPGSVFDGRVSLSNGRDSVFDGRVSVSQGYVSAQPPNLNPES